LIQVSNAIAAARFRRLPFGAKAAGSAAEEPQDQRYDHADDKACNNWEIEPQFPALDDDVAG
jgi:hypothetical protein